MGATTCRPHVQQHVGHHVQQHVGHHVQQHVGHHVQQHVGQSFFFVGLHVSHLVSLDVGHHVYLHVGHHVHLHVGHARDTWMSKNTTRNPCPATWFFFSQKALYVIMYSPKNCKGKYKSLFKSWQWRIRPNQSIQPIFMAEWKRKIANTEEMLSITKYLFADKSDLARGFKAVRHFNIRKFKNESNHNLVLKYWYTWGPFLTPLLSFWLHAADALHAMCKYLFLENKRQKSNFMEEHFFEQTHFFRVYSIFGDLLKFTFLSGYTWVHFFDWLHFF